MTPAGRLRAALLVVALTSACGVEGLSFVADERVEIVSPTDRAEVELPFTVDWTAEGIEGGSFGVLVDRPPPPPGEKLEWLLRDDATCNADPECPNEAYLASRDIYRTTDTSIVIREVPEPVRGERTRQFHEVTVILLDDSGRRVGESAFGIEVELPRAELSDSGERP